MCKAICYSWNQGKLTAVSIGNTPTSPGGQYCCFSSMSMQGYQAVCALASKFFPFYGHTTVLRVLCKQGHLGLDWVGFKIHSAPRDIIMKLSLWSPAQNPTPGSISSLELWPTCTKITHIAYIHVPVALQPLNDWFHRSNRLSFMCRHQACSNKSSLSSTWPILSSL